MTKTTQAALFCLVLTSNARAKAEGPPSEATFGDRGHFVLSGERLFGYNHVTRTDNGGGFITTISNSSISVLGASRDDVVLLSAYTFPRIGFDTFVAPSVSVGGSITYYRSSHAETDNVNANTFKIGFSELLIAPRLGIAVRVAPSIWIWPRAGITYARLWQDDGSTTGTEDLFAATLDVPVVLALAPHVLASVAPTVDIGLSGRNHPNDGFTPPSDIKESDIGLQAGLVVFF
jgi:hypothetical protein